MLESYRRVFAHPGSAAFSGAGIIGRLPIAMMTLGIVILVSSTTGSYEVAGKISAAFVIGNAVVAIPHGRAADRFGQTVVLYADAVLFALWTALLIEAVTGGWARLAAYAFAALAGASMPQIGSMVRARWAHVVSDAERHTAFAVEAVGDELVFVTGPALVTFLSTLYAPQTGLVVALAAGTLGTVLLAAQRQTAPPAHQPTEHGPDPLPWRSLVPIAVAAVMLGALFGALEVSTVAVAEHAGHKGASGALLAVFSLGSMLAGLASGVITWRRSELRRFQTGVAILAAAMTLLPFLDNLVALGAVLFAVGTALAPSLIAVVSLLESSTPRSRLTEAMAFFQTGVSAGLAPGASIAGVAADRVHGPSLYWVCAVAGALTLLAALACRPAPDRLPGVVD